MEPKPQPQSAAGYLVGFIEPVGERKVVRRDDKRCAGLATQRAQQGVLTLITEIVRYCVNGN